MATYDRTWLDHARGQADEIDANAHGLRMIAGERVKDRLAEIDDAQGPQTPGTPGD